MTKMVATWGPAWYMNGADMHPDTYIKKYGIVARLFSGDKQEMWRQVNVRLVELAHSMSPRDTRVPRHLTKRQVQMNLAFEGDWENFGRFFVVTHEPRDSGYGPPFSTEIVFLSGRGVWQEALIQDPDIQSLLAMRESLETGGRVQTPPDRRHGEPYLPPGWNHATSSCRLLTPGRTTGGEDPKKDWGFARGRDYRRNERFAHRRDGEDWEDEIAYSFRGRSPRRRSPRHRSPRSRSPRHRSPRSRSPRRGGEAPASYRAELQHWSVPRANSAYGRRSAFERIAVNASSRSSQTSASSVRSLQVPPRFIRDSDAAEYSDGRGSSPFKPYSSPSNGRDTGRWGSGMRRIHRETKGHEGGSVVLSSPDTERAARDRRWEAYTRDMSSRSDDPSDGSEAVAVEPAVLSNRKKRVNKKDKKLKGLKQRATGHAPGSLRAPPKPSTPEVIEITDTEEEEEVLEKRREEWERDFQEEGFASSDDDLPSVIGRGEKCEKVQASIWMKKYQKITATLKTYNGRFSPSRNKMELGNYGLETNTKLEALTKVVDERTGFEGRRWKKIQWADSIEVMDGAWKIAIREAGLFADLNGNGIRSTQGEVPKGPGNEQIRVWRRSGCLDKELEVVEAEGSMRWFVLNSASSLCLYPLLLSLFLAGPKKTPFSVLNSTHNAMVPHQDVASTSSSETRITAADVVKDPRLVLHSAQPDSPLKPFDGQVGAVIGDTGYVVTSPNTDLIYSPHVGPCTTRMRRDFHFGTDDPLYFPQPFNMKIGHLALIPAPSTSSFHNDALAWYRPKSSDFIPHTSMPCSALGLIAPDLISRFESKSNALISSSLDRPAPVKNDHYVREGRAALQRLVERLQVVSTHEECLLLVACIQRQYLELYARIEWLDKYLPRIQAQEKTHPANLDLMGAFAYSADDLQRLFHAGIPVWFIREVTYLPTLRIDKLVQPIAETANRLLPMRHSEQYVDLADANPPHRLVWTGGWTQGERYAAMARYTRSLHQYPAMGTSKGGPVSPAIILAASSASSSASSSALTPTTQPLVDVLGKGPVILKSDKNKKPYTKPQSKQTRPNLSRNKFLPVEDPLNPAAMPVWSTVLSELSAFHHSRVPEKLGYFLPQPMSLISSENEHRKAYLISTWVKLRPLFLWILAHPGETSPIALKGPQWRSILDLASGLGYKAGTQTSKTHSEMEQLLRKLVSDRRHGVELDMTKLPASPAYWQGQQLSVEKQPPSQLTRQILWELYFGRRKGSDGQAPTIFSPVIVNMVFQYFARNLALSFALFALWISSRALAARLLSEKVHENAPILRGSGFTPSFDAYWLG
ncbi:hypothetical protein K435DRAFT_793991 [Dendrothele bispora CBS 962.96]|uniref:Uncharacterized protein n=1 Tax=Dendrothele bispora (strain CBS 962.96) TaxID=1314807 RepID=A0A4S8MDN6_DENBC|nr:hypothetical protein K435DRAFT_793991 [Dendrothele bispora CBS 962.96]